MIVKNEEDVLERCLTSVKDFVDEMIIIDTGSTDTTKKIAEQFTKDIYDFEWIDDFSAARNFSFSKATKDYILWLDADDVIDGENKGEFIKLKKELSFNVDSVLMKYNLSFDSKGKPTYSTMRNRLVKREKGFKWFGVVHEYLEVYGNIIPSEIGIRHNKLKLYTDRNLRIYREKVKKNEKLAHRDLFYFGNELKDHLLFEEALEVYEEFLQTKEGWIEDNITACINMASCYENIYETEEQISCLLRSMLYDTPRAEVCCKLGEIYLSLKEYNKAIFWYELVLILGEPPVLRGLGHDEAAWTWLPYLQLCVCYDKIGNIEKFIEYHLKTKEMIPDHPSVIHNEKYMKETIKRKE
jgi:glycosyltransferase involved in cell wall biosynthesis